LFGDLFVATGAIIADRRPADQHAWPLCRVGDVVVDVLRDAQTALAQLALACRAPASGREIFPSQVDDGCGRAGILGSGHGPCGTPRPARSIAPVRTPPCQPPANRSAHRWRPMNPVPPVIITVSLMQLA